MRRAPWYILAAIVTILASDPAWAQGRGRGEPGGGQKEPEKGKEEAQPAEVTPYEAPARAALGERLPDLEAANWLNSDSSPSLARYRDHIVVILFFSTDDSQSVEALTKLNEIHKSQGQKGIAVVGLTPQKKDRIETLVKGKDLKFPIGCEAKTDERYQVGNFPRVYLLDTASRLVDRFHPGEGLEERIQAQVAKTPPPGADPEALKARYEKAKSEFDKQEFGRAFTLARNVSKLAPKDSEVGKKSLELMKAATDAAKKKLDEVRDLAKRGKTLQELEPLFPRLAELSVRFAGEEIGRDADNEIGRLGADAQSKAKLRKAVENAKGLLRVDVAADHEASKRFLEALKQYREVTEDFPDTEASKVAEAAIDRIASDTAAQAEIARLRGDEEADRWLDLADRFARLEMYDKAREYYDRIIQSHPAARAAPKAKERLAKLPAAGSEDGEATQTAGAGR